MSAKRLSGRDMAICIADSGAGIPVEQRNHVLERFVRLDSARSQPGSGIGLSLAVAIAELHGGRLSLEDGLPRGDGVGLEARLILPLAS